MYSCFEINIIMGWANIMSKLSRSIKKDVEIELWIRSGGRCQFSGCNRIVNRSPVTRERVNISEKAHIYSYSEKGPRGWGPYKNNLGELNSAQNLMLLCHDCHTTIDQNHGKYSADLLTGWKEEHERRIEIVTGIASNKKTNVIFYGSNIGDQKSPIDKNSAIEAMFPDRYPAHENPIILSMTCSHKDKTPEFWKTESTHLKQEFLCQIQNRIIKHNSEEEPAHFSLFSFAPIPLLIKLGTLFTDKIDIDVYQSMREPKTWRWQEFPEDFKFVVKEPECFSNPPALIISLSDKIDYNRVKSILGDGVSIWELTVPDKFIGNDNIRSKVQLSMFRSVVRQLMIDIKEKHGFDTSLSIFPTMGIACSVEMGRIRMPKADMPWVIYDQNNDIGSFIEAIKIGGTK